MGLSRIQKLKQRQALASEKRVTEQLDLEGLAAKLAGGPLRPTQKQFIFSPERIAWYPGPAGCAKTTSLCVSLLLPALLYPGSRWGIFRWVYWSLQETTMERFFECVARLGPRAIVDKVQGPPMKVWLASAVQDERGQPGEPSEFIFHGLDDFEKIGGTAFTGIGVDECNEIDRSMAETLNLRLRFKRPQCERPQGPYFLRLASNPVMRRHWLHRSFCQESDCDPVPFGAKFKPQPRENEMNLPEGYYDDAASRMSPEMKIRMIDGECGPDPSGQAVFPEFTEGVHVGTLHMQREVPMIRSWDFGRRRPACVWAQATPEGWVNRLLCLLGENESLEVFLQRVLLFSSSRFSGAREWQDFCDPHGDARRDVTDITSCDVLRRAGLNPRYRDVNVEQGLGYLSMGLNTLVRGRPRSMYDRAGCAILIEGYMGGYQYQMVRPGHPDKPAPFKDGYYEHPMDCDRYLEVNLRLGSTLKREQHLTSLRPARRHG